MASYISSNANRFYAAIETAYGQAATVNAQNRFPAVQLQAEQLVERGRRLDKTGTRTFLALSPSSRRHTAFEVRAYLTSWSGSGGPPYGPLVQSAFGTPSQLSSGLIVAALQSPIQIQTTVPHGLSMGSAVSYLNEIRFITGVPDIVNLVINAPFSNDAEVNATLSPAVTYRLSSALPSITLYDYWDPITAVSRIVTGAAVDTFEVSINGDYHELIFSGPAANLIDSASFAPGSAGLSSFPTEPNLANFNCSIVPGNLGQLWLGSASNRFFTLTEAHIEVKNNINLRNREYGSSYPLAIAPGPRRAVCDFTLLAQDNPQTAALYAAGKNRQAITAMLQLGQRQRELMGIFMPKIMPEVPRYDDSETRLQWHFNNNLGQGIADDEIYVAFA
jgi:hypothetical protein